MLIAAIDRKLGDPLALRTSTSSTLRATSGYRGYGGSVARGATGGGGGARREAGGGAAACPRELQADFA